MDIKGAKALGYEWVLLRGSRVIAMAHNERQLRLCRQRKEGDEIRNISNKKL